MMTSKEGQKYNSGTHFGEINRDAGIYQGTLHLAKLLKINNFLDIGCRDGQFTEIIRGSTGAEAHGIDIEQAAISIAIEKSINAHVVDMESEPIPYRDNFFDCVVSVGVIEHVYNKDHFIEEIRRVLKPNGDLILATPNLSSWLSRLLLLFGYQPIDTITSVKHSLGFPPGFVRWPPNDHINLCTYKALIELLKIYGFEPKKKIGESIFAERLLWLRSFERIIFKIFPSLGGIAIVWAKNQQ